MTGGKSNNIRIIQELDIAMLCFLFNSSVDCINLNIFPTIVLMQIIPENMMVAVSHLC